MTKITLALQMLLDETAPQGPGWYIVYYMDGQATITPVLVDNEIALRLASSFHSAIDSSDAETPNIMPQQIVQSGNNLVLEELKKQLEKAEAAISKVHILRQRLYTIDQKKADTI